MPHLTPSMTLFVGLILVFFLIPYIPGQLLMLTDYIVIRILLLAALISVAYISPMSAIVAFIVIAMLFIERNKYKMYQVRRAMSQSTPDSPAIESIVTPETAPYQPPFEEPEKTRVPFFPDESSGDNSFAPVAPSQNHKQPLETERSNDGSQVAIEQLFEWVNPSLVQAS